MKLKNYRIKWSIAFKGDSEYEEFEKVFRAKNDENAEANWRKWVGIYVNYNGVLFNHKGSAIISIKEENG